MCVCPYVDYLLQPIQLLRKRAEVGLVRAQPSAKHLALAYIL